MWNVRRQGPLVRVFLDRRYGVECFNGLLLLCCQQRRTESRFVQYLSWRYMYAWSIRIIQPLMNFSFNWDLPNADYRRSDSQIDVSCRAPVVSLQSCGVRYHSMQSEAQSRRKTSLDWEMLRYLPNCLIMEDMITWQMPSVDGWLLLPIISPYVFFCWIRYGSTAS